MPFCGLLIPVTALSVPHLGLILNAALHIPQGSVMEHLASVATGRLTTVALYPFDMEVIFRLPDRHPSLQPPTFQIPSPVQDLLHDTMKIALTNHHPLTFKPVQLEEISYESPNQ